MEILQSNHQSGFSSGQGLCDRLLSSLQVAQASCKREQVKRWCKFSYGTAVAYVYHRKTMNRITIYLVHKVKDSDLLAGITQAQGVVVRRRDPETLTSSWA